MSKVKKRNYRKRQVEEDETSNSISRESTPTAASEEPTEVGENLEELLELRKFRRRQQGIDVQVLDKGDPKSKKKRQDVKKDEEGEEKRPKVLETFTTQTDALDVDKHMMAYIEEEMRKRNGNPSEEDEAAGGQSTSNELFQVPDHLKVEKKPINETNINLSTTMLTAIPEVDLGIDTRLRNIEETEKAKLRMLLNERDMNVGSAKSTDKVVLERFKKRYRK
ncbi:hypothetical protein K493DRAFT_261146 [Basidiobolus meristosporus CBS 931.73]|uniref:Hepatocellular carcinoma-associated antigen 59 n=1 Tax=Basidiobolus meristosporus CBS 931.73 TaxID=1314790 RepID=A0A1Y1Y9X9_9FUNG|nr:hypothetical protein K493DRAFT_261146 [Basidiobolus meristosporus CBS 931.73]|eukprot:ORX94807.1 hypothetical protein K493DRAFT_261146 [Basidiobolus meristosporus CBS 931.73]